MPYIVITVLCIAQVKLAPSTFPSPFPFPELVEGSLSKGACRRGLVEGSLSNRANKIKTSQQRPENKMIKGYIYILECADGSYYTGSTRDITRRLAQHQNGEGANYTRKRLPVTLVFQEEYERIDDAYYREKQVQGWSRKKKQALINGDFDKLQELSKNTLRQAPFDGLRERERERGTDDSENDPPPSTNGVK